MLYITLWIVLAALAAIVLFVFYSLFSIAGRADRSMELVERNQINFRRYPNEK